MKNRVEEIRKREGLTQEDFARSIGVSRQTVSSIENGRYNPSLELAFKISGVLRMRIEDIFIYGGDKDEDQ